MDTKYEKKKSSYIMSENAAKALEWFTTTYKTRYVVEINPIKNDSRELDF